MELRDYLHVLQKRWRLITACAVIAVALAVGLCLHATPKYQSSTQFFVSTSAANSDPGDFYTGSLLSEERGLSYADIMNGPLLADQVSKKLGGLNPAVIQREISAKAVANTVLLDVTVTDPSAARATLIATQIGKKFPKIANGIEARTAGTSPVKVTVVKQATSSNTPVSPKTVRDVILALLIGLLFGVGLAVLRDTLDLSVKDPNEIQEDFGLPTLGAIAYDPDAPKRPLVVQADPRSPRAEAFRQLRTNLQFLDVDRAPRSLVISSSIPEEGKTTTATNLAITMAQSGMRVLIVEGDLRRPRLATYLGLEGAVGLTSVLIGRATIEQAIQPWGDGQLHVLASGPTPPNPSELLGSQGMSDIIKELEQSYDFVLIDAPPLLPVTDAAVIATAAGGAILVVRHGHTKQRQLAHATAALRSVDATLYGVVLTMVPTKGPDAYYYGYNYSYNNAASAPRADSNLTELKPREVMTAASARTTVAASNGHPQPAGVTVASSTHNGGAETSPSSENGSGYPKPASLGALRRNQASTPSAEDDPLDYFNS